MNRRTSKLINQLVRASGGKLKSRMLKRKWNLTSRDERPKLRTIFTILIDEYRKAKDGKVKV